MPLTAGEVTRTREKLDGQLRFLPDRERVRQLCDSHEAIRAALEAETARADSLHHALLDENKRNIALTDELHEANIRHGNTSIELVQARADLATLRAEQERLTRELRRAEQERDADRKSALDNYAKFQSAESERDALAARLQSIQDAVDACPTLDDPEQLIECISAIDDVLNAGEDGPR